MSTQTTYLITGANRGIGAGFTKTLLQRPHTTVIAAVRDPSHRTSKALSSLPKAPSTSLIIVKLDASIPADAAEAVQQLTSEHNIAAIDVVIANAGIGGSGNTVRKTSSANTLDHFTVNVLGPISLFQATAPLLNASPSGNPKFIAISTIMGSIGSMEALSAFPNVHSPYGGSKAALNWFVRRLHFEEEWLTSWVMHPGLVETDMAAKTVEGTGLELKDFGAITVEQSVEGMLGTIDGAGRENSGTFRNYDGAALPW